MPRRRPSLVRAARRPSRRAPETTSKIKGLSPQALAEIGRLESGRGYLWPGAAEQALRLWRECVHNPYRLLWVAPPDGGCGFWECCGDPWEARRMLEAIRLRLSRRRARELDRILAPLDDLY